MEHFLSVDCAHDFLPMSMGGRYRKNNNFVVGKKERQALPQLGGQGQQQHCQNHVDSVHPWYNETKMLCHFYDLPSPIPASHVRVRKYQATLNLGIFYKDTWTFLKLSKSSKSIKVWESVNS